MEERVQVSTLTALLFPYCFVLVSLMGRATEGLFRDFWHLSDFNLMSITPQITVSTGFRQFFYVIALCVFKKNPQKPTIPQMGEDCSFPNASWFLEMVHAGKIRDCHIAVDCRMRNSSLASPPSTSKVNMARLASHQDAKEKIPDMILSAIWSHVEIDHRVLFEIWVTFFCFLYKKIFKIDID